MSAPPASGSEQDDRVDRPYDGTLRRERAAETRQRIIAAGSELLHRASVHDWRRLTIRAVAEQAGVNERTIYRHFGNERGFAGAVMHRLEDEAGIDLEGLQLRDIANVMTRVFEHVATFPSEPRPPLDPTLIDANERQKGALLGAVSNAATRWSPGQQVMTAALFDVLWSVATYERLVLDWGIDLEQAVRGISWVMGLVGDAVETGRGPL